ncbi:L,D-transpeptidase [Microbacterium sp. cx-55]|uniref:L,D-transpeptidase n=1 Tax=Microbacterium sp. cx-55 TaxID=2875948 RepID=UPI001CBBEC6F|nr:L,D-transpeptidase [Microbacterium sp. cx-55]MBZ4486679.1 L,D-transpeptidase [Microbacterium sp. cx-55]UGB36361.1 L,D-transpeptidase [Microbacterium sp. cx-55]
MPPASARRRWLPLAIAAATLAAAALVLVLVMGMDRTPVTPAAAPASPVATPTATPTPTPSETGAPVDATSYDVSGLPAAEVYSVIPALPVDADPGAALPGLLATPASAAIPVFAAPGEAPVAQLPQAQTYGGTTVPVVERQTNWVRVLVSGRQGTPPGGNPAQLSGWLRASDVTLTEDATRVDVSLSARTVSIVTPAGTETIATDFGWGAAATPTPLGRTFIMHTAVVPSFGYTRGHPLVYLGVQSPTLAGFSGASVAVTAFHYHDAHSGAISNGCLRLDAAAIDRLAQLPLGTPVVVTG